MNEPGFAVLKGGPYDQHTREVIGAPEPTLRLPQPGQRTGDPLQVLYALSPRKRGDEGHLYDYVGWE